MKPPDGRTMPSTVDRPSSLTLGAAGGEERLEDARQDVGRDGGTGVAERDGYSGPAG
ncbi:MAG TPA: hypothetical protein VK726_26345 [Acetobacteraceae bacterium]|jgi:hypothetical protein|nr:hypothetical protein [Acetobacteraceae bacterium]